MYWNENKESVKRKTGAENILLYGVPGAGKSHEIKTKYCDDEKLHGESGLSSRLYIFRFCGTNITESGKG